MEQKKDEIIVVETTVKERALKLLPEEEKQVLEDFRKSGKPGLAPTTSSAFFELYLNGNSVYEIQKMNKVFDLGAIIDAKVKYGWDEMKDRYVGELQAKAMARLVQVQSESVGFLADVLAAAHKKHGTALKRYLQTGDTRDLEGFDINNITSYSKSIEALLKITGQDNKKKVQVEGNLTSTVNVNNLTEKALSPDQAASLLEILAAANEDTE
jgi:hypothetical protein